MGDLATEIRGEREREREWDESSVVRGVSTPRVAQSWRFDRVRRGYQQSVMWTDGKKHKTTNNNYEGPVGMVNTHTFQETEVRPKNNSSLLKKKEKRKKILAGRFAEKKILICPSTFHFKHELHLFCFPSLPFGLTKPYLFFLDRGYDLEIVRHSCG